MSIEERLCETFSSSEREYDECIRNPKKFITTKTVKFVGNVILNIGVRKIVEYLPTIVV